MSKCKHYLSPNGWCRIGEFNGKPLEDDCMSCDRYDGPSRGLGDQIEKVLIATGVQRIAKAISGGKGCGCGKRKKAMNKAFPKKGQDNA